MKNTLSSTNGYLDSEFPQKRGLYRSSLVPENRTHTQNLAGKLRQRICRYSETDGKTLYTRNRGGYNNQESRHTKIYGN